MIRPTDALHNPPNIPNYPKTSGYKIAIVLAANTIQTVKITYKF